MRTRSTLIGAALLGCAGILAIAAATTAAAQDPIRLTYASAYSSKDQLGQLVKEHLPRLLEKHSDGKLTADVHIDSALCSEQGCVEQMKQGAVDIVALSSSNMGAFGTAIDFVTMPYVFRSQDEAKKLLYDWLADAMNARTEEEMGIRLVGFVPNCGYRQLMHNADQVIKRPADLDGIKIRVTKSPTEFNLMKGWGATPVPYDWSAVYEGLQSGVVEGMFTSDCFLWDLSFHEVVDHVVQLDGAWNIGVMVMDSERYEALPEWARAAVDAAGRDLTDLYFAQDAAWQEDRRQQLREKTDLETYVPDEAEMDAWRSGAVEAWKAADGRYDKALMRRILEAQSMSAFIADLEDAGVL